VRLVSPIGGDTGGSRNLSTSLSNLAKLAAHPKFVWVFNANCDGTIIYNDPTQYTGILLKINYERHKSFHFCRAVLSTYSFFY
jgi:hypothetical protein